MRREVHFLQQRNQEIGSVLLQARLQQERSVTACAVLLQTSRRRYTAIERGEIAVTTAELEVLEKFLNISVHACDIHRRLTVTQTTGVVVADAKTITLENQCQAIELLVRIVPDAVH